MNKLPTILILFGITGDLSSRKIIPALFHLYKKNLLPQLFTIVGFSRRDWDKKDLYNFVVDVLAKHKHIEPSKEDLDAFLKMFIYQKGDFDSVEGYKVLGELLGQKDSQWQTCANKLFYLAVPPKYYQGIFSNLAQSGLTKSCSAEEGWTRVIVEKPFGKDLDTALKLEDMLSELFREEQIYRIDHYLGKEIMQNILAFRFSNNLLEKTWDNSTIEQIKVRFIEEDKVDHRGNFYDDVGALRDVGQNHILQMLALTTMDHPGKFEQKNIRRSREEILGKLHTYSKKEAVENTFRAQYGGFSKTKGVEENSDTETYFKILTYIDSERWKGVPITLEGGKALGHSRKEIKLIYRSSDPCYCPTDSNEDFKNRVIINLKKPDEGIEIRFWAKKPGISYEIEEREFTFKFTDSDDSPAEAYEKLLVDCIEGNQELFVSSAEISNMWKFTDPVICAWDEGLVPLSKYESGSAEIMKEPKF